MAIRDKNISLDAKISYAKLASALAGFYGTTPIAKASAYTQTFSTASKTLPAVTSLAAPAGGTGAAAGGWDTAANRDLAITAINAIRTDHESLMKVVTALIDDLQAYGLLQ